MVSYFYTIFTKENHTPGTPQVQTLLTKFITKDIKKEKVLQPAESRFPTPWHFSFYNSYLYHKKKIRETGNLIKMSRPPTPKIKIYLMSPNNFPPCNTLLLYIPLSPFLSKRPACRMSLFNVKSTKKPDLPQFLFFTLFALWPLHE